MKSTTRRLVVGIELIDDPAWIGGTLYLRNLALCLSRLPEEEQPRVVLIGAPHVTKEFLGKWGHLQIFQAPQEIFPGKILRKLGLLADRLNPIDAVYPGFGAQIPGAVTIRWIPDFQHRYLPQLFSTDEISARDRSIGELAEQPGTVVFSSEVAAADFLRFYPQPRSTPRVWHFCSLLDTSRPASLSTLRKFGLPPKYLYLPNQFWAHKNHITVLHALARLRQENKTVIPLVCTGAQSDRRNESHFSSLQRYVLDHSLTDQVHFLGLIDRGEQVDILRHAAAVVQPSLFEGWSTVVEDVRAIGRPIFLSDLPVHREQAPARCTFFVPASADDLAVKLEIQWPKLQAGPDYPAEQRSRQALEDRIIRSGREFMNIVRSSLEAGRG